MYKFFLKLLQNRAKVPVHGLGPNVTKIEKVGIFNFYIFFLMHIHVLMLYRNFELILIKIEFLIVALKLGQSPCTIVHGLGPNFAKIEKVRIFNFYIFS